jgi:hypothetical protein
MIPTTTAATTQGFVVEPSVHDNYLALLAKFAARFPAPVDPNDGWRIEPSAAGNVWWMRADVMVRYLDLCGWEADLNLEQTPPLTAGNTAN